MSPESIGILKKYHLNITRPRAQILDAFIYAERSLDHQYFLHHHKYKLERTTIFRTLRLFTEKKIIYKVTTEGGSKYIFLKDDKNHSEKEEHSSFVCIGCGKAVPIDTIEVSKVNMPQGFTKQDIQIIIRGICPTCKT